MLQLPLLVSFDVGEDLGEVVECGQERQEVVEERHDAGLGQQQEPMDHMEQHGATRRLIQDLCNTPQHACINELTSTLY